MTTSPEIPKDYYSLREAAARTGLSIRTLRRAIDDERLDAVRVGRSIRVAKDDLASFMRRAPIIRKA